MNLDQFEELEQFSARVRSTIEDCGSVYLLTTGPRNLNDLMRGVSIFFPDSCRLLRLDQEMAAYRGVLILKEALQAGQTVILGCKSATQLGEQLLNLRDFRDRTFPFGHNISLGPKTDGPALGKAVVLHQVIEEALGNRPPDYLREQPNYIPLWDDVAALIEEQGRSVSSESVFSIGMRLTMRDLCLLHERDPQEATARPHRSNVEEIIGDQTKMTSWTELQRLIMAPLALEIPVALFNRKQLTEEQFDCYLDAKELLKQAQKARDKASNGQDIYASIYDAVWDLTSSVIPYDFFRGQWSSEWTLQCTLFRSPDHALDNRTLIWRLQQTSAFLQELRANQQRYLGGTVDDDSLLAIAQHFGMPTHLIDFTRSVRVAAFFATIANAEKTREQSEGVIGAIYCLKTNDDVLIVLDGANQGGSTEAKEGANERLRLGRLGEPLGIKIEDLAGIHFGDLRVLTPKLPQQENRIGRQQGVFVENSDPRHLRDGSKRVYYFLQQPGVVFEDPRMGIDKETLLPDDTDLAQLAHTIKERFSSPDAIALDPALASVVMSRPTIIGSMGSLLDVQVRHGDRLLEQLGARLQELGSQEVVGEIREILLNYFEACRMHARLGEVAPAWKNEEPFGGSFLSAVLGLATLRLARWAGVNETAFTNTLVNELDRAPFLPFNEGHSRQEPVLEPKNLRERIALACGYYLLGWEYLRYVGGFRARNLTWRAEELLRRQRQREETI